MIKKQNDKMLLNISITKKLIKTKNKLQRHKMYPIPEYKARKLIKQGAKVLDDITMK